MDNTLKIVIEDDGPGVNLATPNAPRPDAGPMPVYPAAFPLPPPPAPPRDATTATVPPSLQALPETPEVRGAKERIVELRHAIISLAGTGPGATKAIAEFRVQIAELEKQVLAMRWAVASGATATTAGTAATSGATPRAGGPLPLPVTPVATATRAASAPAVATVPVTTPIAANTKPVVVTASVPPLAATGPVERAGESPMTGDLVSTLAAKAPGGAEKAGSAITEAAGAAGLEKFAGKASGPLIALQAAADATVVGMKKFRVGMDAAGESARALAGNDALGAVKPVAKLAAEGLDKIPIVGKAMGESLRTLTATVDTARVVVGAFVDRGKELQAFDARIAMASARSDIRAINADIKEAQRTGEGLARLTDAQSKLDNELRELMLPIKEFVANVLAGAMEEIVRTMKDIRDNSDEAKSNAAKAVEVQKQWDPVLIFTTENISAFKRIIQWAMERIGRPPEHEIAKGIIDELIGAADSLGMPVMPDPNKVRFSQRVEMPIFNGL